MQEIYIDDIGEGYPLVLVHGYLGSSAMWKFQKDYLKNYFRVIAPALPGFGESYKVKSLNSINAMAKIVLKCVQKKKINKFNLMGHSMGGMIVQEIVKIAGHNVNKLICFSTGSIGNIPDRFESLDVSIKRLKEEGIKETTKEYHRSGLFMEIKLKIIIYVKMQQRKYLRKQHITHLMQ